MHERTPKSWPEHDAGVWKDLARQAVRALNQLWDGESQFVPKDAESFGASGPAAPAGGKEARPIPTKGERAKTKGGTSNGDDREAEEASDKGDASEEPGPRADFVTLFRCAETLVDLIDRNRDWSTTAERENLVPQYLRAAVDVDDAEFTANLEPELEGSGTDLHPLAVASRAAALARIALLDPRQYELPGEQEKQLTALAEQARQRLEQEAIPALIEVADEVRELAGVDKDLAQVFRRLHPYPIYHLLRALNLAQLVAEQDEAIADTRSAISSVVDVLTEELIAQNELRVASHAQAVALAFCAAAAALRKNPRRRLIEHAVAAAVEAQDAFGCWALGRMVTRAPQSSTAEVVQIIPSHEVAAAVADSLAALARRGAIDQIPADGVQSVLAALRFVEDSLVELPGGVGWTKTMAYGRPLIDPDACAMALRATISAKALADEVLAREAAEPFDVVDSQTVDWPPFLVWSTYLDESEPEEKVKILDYLDREVVQKAKKETELPWQRPQGQGVLLFGPPGTTKTTIVRALSHGLEWPVVNLSPANFIDEGLDKIEKRATEVFNQLHALRRAIVLFDECDELFRDRGDDSSPGDRGIGAFMTASMLPKIQDLHDRAQVIFFIVTNYFERMDPAIRRLGRIDHIIAVGPADDTQRRRTMEKEYKPEDGPGRAALKELVDETKNYARGDLVRAAQTLASRAPFGSVKDGRKAAKAIGKRMRGALAISEKAISTYEKYRDEVSQPHLQKAGKG